MSKEVIFMSKVLGIASYQVNFKRIAGKKKGILKTKQAHPQLSSYLQSGTHQVLGTICIICPSDSSFCYNTVYSLAIKMLKEVASYYKSIKYISMCMCMHIYMCMDSYIYRCTYIHTSIHSTCICTYIAYTIQHKLATNGEKF